MSYINADEVLPKEMIELIQQYVDGENIYIPKKSGNRTKWGTRTFARQELSSRNNCIYNDYCSGMLVSDLSEKYFLSVKSIQRIIYDKRKQLEQSP